MKKIFVSIIFFILIPNIAFAKANDKIINQIKHDIINKNQKITVPLNRKIDIIKVINDTFQSYKNLNYIISELKKESTNKEIIYHIKYMQANFTANNQSELNQILKKQIKKANKNFTVKINKSIKSIDIYKTIINLDITDSVFFINNFSYKTFFLPSLPNYTIVSFNFEYVNLSNYENKGKQKFIKNYSELYSFIKNNIENFHERMDIVLLDNSLVKQPQIIFDCINNILEDHGELHYIKSYGSITLGNKVVVLIKYVYPKEQLIEIKKTTENIAKEVIKKIITEDMTDYEKEKAIHDYIINNTKYDLKGVLIGKIPPESSMPFGVLISKTAVCNGYSTTFNYLLKLAGIQSKIVFGYVKDTPHSWNLVKLNNSWFHVDVTFDDPIINNGEIDIISYKYFNVTDEYISKTHSYDKKRYPKSSLLPHKNNGSHD